MIHLIDESNISIMSDAIQNAQQFLLVDILHIFYEKVGLEMHYSTAHYGNSLV